MSMGTVTFGSLASLSQYRNQQNSSATQPQTQATSISPVSSQIPTGAVDSRTDQALVWSGLKAASSSNESPQSSFFSSATGTASANRSSYTAPDLDFAYSFASVKGILAYRDALLARNPDAPATLGQNLSQKS